MPGPLSSPGRARWALGILLALAAGASTTAAPAVLGRDPAALVLSGFYDVAGVRHPLVAVWSLRQDGTRLMATALGALESQTIEAASIDRRSVQFTLRHGKGPGAQALLFDGGWNGRRLNGRVSGAGGSGRLALEAADLPVVERGMVVAGVDETGAPVEALNLSLVIDGSGRLVGGRFVSDDPAACPTLGCGGRVVAFDESPPALSLRLQTDDACPIDTDITLTFDMSRLIYSGAFTTTGCAAESGAVLAARAVGTSGEHASQVLQALGRLADDIESDAFFARPHPSFSTAYLHSGRTANDVLLGFELERSRFTARRATFEPVRTVRTIVDPLALPGLDLPPLGVDFDERREGTPRAGGPPEAYVDSRTRPSPPRLAIWAEEASRWVIRGNGYTGYDLPFEYTATPRALEVPTPGGTVYVSPGPYGAHTGPLTGHVFGDGKANFIGFFSDGDAEMVDLGDGDGTREPGEPWGFYGGADGSLIRSRIPTYVAPADAVLDEIRYSAPSGTYFDNVPHWGVEIRFPDDTAIALGHLGAIAPALRNRVLDALGIDLWTYTGPEGVVVGRDSGIRVLAGETLAQPQVMAGPMPGHPGYYTGPGAGGIPWAQMEFGFIAPVFGPVRGNNCVYEHLPRASHLAIQRIIDTEMTDPQSTRYRPYLFERWLWSAEGRACLAYTLLPMDFTSLDTRLGGWFERPDASIASDEIFVVFRMARDTPAYTPGLYDPRNVGQLVRRQRAGGVQWNWLMPDGTTARPFYPAGELLERTASTLLIKWRDIGYRDASRAPRPVYQWASYVLDASGLKVHWGPFLDDPGDGGGPALSSATPCNGTSVVCYDHTERPGY